MKLLYVNACTRKDSRTKKLAEHLLHQWDGDVEEIDLYKGEIPLLDEAACIERGRAASDQDVTNPFVKLALSFRDADAILIAAPFWDMGFPAVLKSYIEAIMITGITFAYTLEGRTMGLCHAGKLVYVTKAGGPIPPVEFGYSYVKFLAREMWGIADCTCFQAEGLDIVGADVDKILEQAMEEMDSYDFKEKEK